MRDAKAVTLFNNSIRLGTFEILRSIKSSVVQRRSWSLVGLSCLHIRCCS